MDELTTGKELKMKEKNNTNSSPSQRVSGRPKTCQKKMMNKKRKGRRAQGQMKEKANLDNECMTLYNETRKGVVQPMEAEEARSF